MKKYSIFAMLVSAAMLAGCTAGANFKQVPQTVAAETEPEQSALAAYQAIVPEQAREMIGLDGVVLLDVRTQEEYDEAHIQGAVLLPYDAISASPDKLPQDKDTVIIVYCRSGRRSAIAAQTLADMGYTQIFDLGGIQSWPYGTVTG